MKLTFVTSNPNKVTKLADILTSYGITLVQEDMDIPEIQADTCLEVAVAKAHYALEKLQRPLIVADSSLSIQELNGFPGVFMKQITRQIGIRGYLQLLWMKQLAHQRACTFSDAIVFIAPKEHSTVFERHAHGHLCQTEKGENVHGEVQSFRRLFIPTGYEKTIAEMTTAEQDAHRQHAGLNDSYHALGQMLAEKESL